MAAATQNHEMVEDYLLEVNINLLAVNITIVSRLPAEDIQLIYISVMMS